MDHAQYSRSSGRQAPRAPQGGEVYDFETVPDRRGTGSIKWDGVAPGTIPLGIADMDVVSPAPVLAAFAARGAHGVFGYTNPTADDTAAAAAFLSRRHKLEVKPEWIKWMPGVISGLNVALRAFAGEGAGVVLHTPAYGHFLSSVEDQRCVHIDVPLVGDASLMAPEDIEKAIAAAPPGVTVRALILCNPHNPTGRSWGADELRAVGDVCARHDLVVIADEIWQDVVFADGGAHAHVPFLSACPELASRTVMLTSASKTFNLAGLSCAVAVIPDAAARAKFSDSIDGSTGDVNAFGLAAARAAWGGQCDAWVDQLIVHLRKTRAEVLSVLQRLPRLRWTRPEATYLFWIDARDAMPPGVTPDTLARYLRSNFQIAVSDGKDFRRPGFVRINFGCPTAQIVEAMRRFEAAFESSARQPAAPQRALALAAPAHGAAGATQAERQQLELLRGVGFEDGSLHLYLLRKCGHDIEKVLLELVVARDGK